MVIKNQFIMKKVLISLFALMAVMTVQAQTICATWRSMQPIVETDDDESFTAQHFTYTFNEDGTYTLVDEMTIASEPAQTMALEVATNVMIKGTYTLKGDKLTLTPDKKTYKTELINISRNGRVVNDAKVKTNINKMVNSYDFKERFTNAESCTVRVGDYSLDMTKGGQTYNFVRLATIKN